MYLGEDDFHDVVLLRQNISHATKCMPSIVAPRSFAVKGSVEEKHEFNFQTTIAGPGKKRHRIFPREVTLSQKSRQRRIGCHHEKCPWKACCTSEGICRGIHAVAPFSRRPTVLLWQVIELRATHAGCG